MCARVKDNANNVNYVSGKVDMKVYLKVLPTDTTFKLSSYKQKINQIQVVNNMDTTGAIATWDLSQNADNTIKGWITTNTQNTTMYNLSIGSEFSIYATNLTNYFREMENVSSVNLELLHTNEVINMGNMFNGVGSSSQVVNIYLGNNFSATNATNVSSMFYQTCGYGKGTTCGSLTIRFPNNFNASLANNMYQMFYQAGIYATNVDIDLGNNFGGSNVTSMSQMFYQVGNNATNFNLKLGNINTIKVTDTRKMFERVGNKATILNLNLGDNFDMGNCTNTSNMFNHMGFASAEFNLHLGNNFNASKVATVVAINNMFENLGYNATNFTLNLGNNFNISTINNTYYLFIHTGSQVQGNYYLDLGNNFNIKNVTNMYQTFGSLGINARNVTINLGNNFNMAKATNAFGMFRDAAKNGNGTIIFNAGNNFNTSNITVMSNMFRNLGANATSFNINLGNKFDMTKVTTAPGTFDNIGKNTHTAFNLDLAAGNFTNISNYEDMLSRFPTAKGTIYVKDAASRTWITGKNSSWGTNFSASNVLIK